jgi:hypothetical protein
MREYPTKIIDHIYHKLHRCKHALPYVLGDCYSYLDKFMNVHL